jgi:hypothetical protein
MQVYPSGFDKALSNTVKERVAKVEETTFIKATDFTH